MGAYDQYNDVKYAVITENTAATHEIVAAVTDRHIEVLDFLIVAAATQQANFESGTTDITGVMSMAAGVPLNGGFSPAGKFRTAKGEALQLTLAQGQQTSGYVVYREARI